MLIVVACDVPDDRRRTRLAHAPKDFGERVNYTNEVKLLLNALAYNLVHALRVLMETITGEGWGLKRVVERLLKVPALLLLHSRRVLLILNSTAASLWASLWSALERWRWMAQPNRA
jgi:hypothetical protein